MRPPASGGKDGGGCKKCLDGLGNKDINYWVNRPDRSAYLLPSMTMFKFFAVADAVQSAPQMPTNAYEFFR
ncbi:hypothetical protein C6366_05045 [Desulfonatronum sp. SC1]|nr:hypothetical protein C6366_05045 [Desulfonatronum sp. SC1]